jgi:hypothetical protein
MIHRARRLRSLLLSAISVSALLGCASSIPSHTLIEAADETDVQGCTKLGIVTGNTSWGGFTGQKLSLELAKKRAMDKAWAKGATRVLWTKTSSGIFGAAATGKAYACRENPNIHAENSDKVIPVSKSLESGNQTSMGYAAVMRFESASLDSGASMVITDIFTNQIQSDGKYRVMERSQVNKILKEQGFQASGACNSAECAVEIGKLLSIDKLFIGSIGKLGQTWFINIRVVDIRTGEILSNLSNKVTGKVDNLSSAAIQMANEFSR